uniref:Uncharacterized protein n=1 Tax=Myotis myotis TaxID=51298 RepID=A0A7J7V474_MYOMY|nr:hypothetical protein mMyoMyo1_008523 [Myotis myotis]
MKTKMPRRPLRFKRVKINRIHGWESRDRFALVRWHVLHSPQRVGKQVLVHAKEYPTRQIHQGNEAHEIERVVGVVPGAGATGAQAQAPGQLPQVDEHHIDGHPLPGAPAATVVQVEIELFHHEAAAAVHEEGPERRVAAGGPVPLSQHVKEEGEEDLIQKAVHPVKEKAEQVRQPLAGDAFGAPGAAGASPPATRRRRGGSDAGRGRGRGRGRRRGGAGSRLQLPPAPQAQEAAQEHLRVVERQQVLQRQVQRPRRPRAARPGAQAEQQRPGRQGLQPHVRQRVEEEIEDQGAGAAPPLQTSFGSC